jgi:hypothetical protein
LLQEFETNYPILQHSFFGISKQKNEAK